SVKHLGLPAQNHGWPQHPKSFASDLKIPALWLFDADQLESPCPREPPPQGGIPRPSSWHPGLWLHPGKPFPARPETSEPASPAWLAEDGYNPAESTPAPKPCLPHPQESGDNPLEEP